jgi:hypothetical protein
MRLKRIISLGALSLALLVATTASAQVQTGSIQGTVTDETTGVPMLLVTVVASSPALQGTQSEFTDDSGQYFMSNIPTGRYSLLFIYGDAKVKRENVDVGVGKTTVVNAKINTQSTGEVITIKEKAPTIDAGSTKQGTTLNQDYMKNIPGGRTWQGILGAAAGSQGDQYGTSFSGSTSVENSYVVDGINTSGVTLGAGTPTLGASVINNFIQEIEVITGGYNAEFGRSTGGVVNVVTKTGSNEFHGSVFANVQALHAAVDPVVEQGVAQRVTFDPRDTVDFGFELGGPIIKDRLWFYVGFAPQLQRETYHRIVATATDRNVRGFNYNNPDCVKNADGVTCDGDGRPATNPLPGCELLPPPPGRQTACEADNIVDQNQNGFNIFEEIERRNQTASINSYQFTGKVNFAVAPEHQGQIGITGTPVVVSNFHNGFAGTPSATQRNETNLTTDASFKWTSKFFDNKTQADVIVGWHRYKRDTESINAFLPNSPEKSTAGTPITQLIRDATRANLDAVGRNFDENESDRVLEFCSDNTPQDAFKTIRNCPVSQYRMNSPGTIVDLLEQRWSGKATITQRVKAAGHHQFKAGIDVESNLLDNTRSFTGGKFINSEAGTWYITRYVKTGAGPDFCGVDDHGTADPADDSVVPCTYLNDLPVHGNTFNMGAFLQDSWSILPNLTVNAGLRYEQQYLRYAEQVKGTIDPITMQPLPKNAMSLTDLIAPRVGLIFDWTKEGRSKVYANWGRFYESIPMDINDRTFGGEVTYEEEWANNQCGAPPTGPNAPKFPSMPENCPAGALTNQPASASVIGGGGGYGAPFQVSLVMPDVSAQYLDELVMGVEYEVLEDLRVGLSYQNRRVGRVIEDVSTDGAANYFIANPGEFSSGAEADLVRQIQQMSPGEIQDDLIDRLTAFRETRNFDKPQRVYNAVQLTASKRFSRAFMMQGSYTYSKLEGNYPGLFAPESGQLDPNITSQYDLFELLANRLGPMAFDRPHSFKLDGYYKFDLKQAGTVTAGARLRAQSGQPINPIGAHLLYGATESFILPRGTDGRTNFETGVDLHMAYGKKLGSSMELEVFFELFNVLNNQGETSIDLRYTQENIDPIVGGDLNDLRYLKPYRNMFLNGIAFKQAAPATRFLNYKNTDVKQAPLSARIGLTLSF